MTTIRHATPADIPLMHALIRELAEFEREPQSVKITEEQLLRDGFGPSPCYECLIAEEDSVAAGSALFFPVYSTWRGRGLHLEDLFVRPQFRGRGIGKALLSRVAAIAVEKGCAKLQWEVLDWNQPAIDFYHSIGAHMLHEWRIMRVTGDALQALASPGEVSA
ncbi:GNAT family N-acetyltransferase [Alloacidobacterium dinghuense]|uniref:GNAT family N-acetyltransferase n=1 Tax=Alloacidobacterium dinghuense TaxID=2763107 RepID=A0A7G8BLF0_9BACT|nr:GNAT family N-acetyltransferase [Alloacidobacterium dinghuense]QNI33370.1 GNAT family N-acetyltransferase [Alloacidobacterium dinghuense]